MSTPKPILAFDTALGECSVALWKTGAIAAAEYETERNRQTSRLVPMIKSVMRQAGVSFADLGCIATTSGPGSFTGIRIGLSVARGFTLACGVPSLAVSTLELLAWQAGGSFLPLPLGEVAERSDAGEGIRTVSTPSPVSDDVLADLSHGERYRIAVSINAYRGEVYCQNFAYQQEKLTALSEASAVLQEDFAATLPAQPHVLISDETIRPDAAALADYVARAALNPADYPARPFYIRAPDAKIQTPLLAS